MSDAAQASLRLPRYPVGRCDGRPAAMKLPNKLA